MNFKISTIPAECIVLASAGLPPAHSEVDRRSVEISDSRLGQIRITFKPVCSSEAARLPAGYWQVEHAERIQRDR